MTRDAAAHLSGDELDSYLTESPSADAMSHVATCAACAALVQADGQLVAALAQLPLFETSPGFSERVVARIGQPVAAPVTPRARAARRRGAGMAVIGAGIFAAAFAWAGGHPVAAVRLTGPALQHAGHALSMWWQIISASVTTHPWFATIHSTLGSPARTVFTIAAIAAAYSIALSGFRQLMTEPASNASW